MKTKIFYTTNAGVYFSAGHTEILIDGIHDAAAVGFDPMTEAMNDRLVSEEGLFAGPGMLLFTHLHKDHYDAGKVRRYLERHPETAVWGPGLKNRGVGDTGEGRDEKVTLGGGDFEITAYKTLHSGENFRYIPHYSFLLNNTKEGEAFFVSGDALFDPEMAARIKEDCGRSAGRLTAFVTAYQLIEAPSKAFLTKLAPARLVLIHQPPEGGEVSESFTSIMDYIRKSPPGGIRAEEPDPMSWI